MFLILKDPSILNLNLLNGFWIVYDVSFLFYILLNKAALIPAFILS